MATRDIIINGARTVGKYSLKGFMKGGKFIGRNAMNVVGNMAKSTPSKKVVGLGATVVATYLFAPAIVTARMFKDLVIDNGILGKQISPMQSLQDSIRATNEFVEKNITDPALDTLGNGVKSAGDKIFGEGGER